PAPVPFRRKGHESSRMHPLEEKHEATYRWPVPQEPGGFAGAKPAACTHPSPVPFLQKAPEAARRRSDHLRR
ncbi:MAG: hypothetical protein AAF943_05245, partial [Pseudomonadota bacterium]